MVYEPNTFIERLLVGISELDKHIDKIPGLDEKAWLDLLEVAREYVTPLSFEVEVEQEGGEMGIIKYRQIVGEIVSVVSDSLISEAVKHRRESEEKVQTQNFASEGGGDVTRTAKKVDQNQRSIQENLIALFEHVYHSVVKCSAQAKSDISLGK